MRKLLVLVILALIHHHWPDLWGHFLHSLRGPLVRSGIPINSHIACKSSEINYLSLSDNNMLTFVGTPT